MKRFLILFGAMCLILSTITYVALPWIALVYAIKSFQ